MKRNLTTILALLLVLVFGLNGLALAENTSDYHDLIPDVAYLDDGDANHTLDIYGAKEKAEPTKTVV